MAAWAALSLALLVRAFAAGVLGRSAPGPGPAVPLRLDVNVATVAELMALPGIGRTRAEALVLHRVRHGPFRDAAALARVDGIGPETAAGIAAHVDFGAAHGRR